MGLPEMRDIQFDKHVITMQCTLLNSQCVCLTNYINYKVIKEHKEELSYREIIDFSHIFSNQEYL